MGLEFSMPRHFWGKSFLPESPIFPAVPHLPKLVLGQLPTHTLPRENLATGGVTFKHNICCFTGLAKPILSQWIRGMRNSVTRESDTIGFYHAYTQKWVMHCILMNTNKNFNIQWRYCFNTFCSFAIISCILKIPGECWRGLDAINKVSVTWPSAAINLQHLPVSPSLRFSLCFHISLSLPLRPTSPSSLSNSILLES